VVKELAMEVGVPGKNPEEDYPVRANLDDLGDAGVGVVVAYDQVAPRVDLDAGRSVVEVAIGEATFVDPGEVHPHVPGSLLHDPHCRPIRLR
jgi:hypothetical protein